MLFFYNNCNNYSIIFFFEATINFSNNHFMIKILLSRSFNFKILVKSCDVGFYGNPVTPGGTCQRCPCNGGACDQETGRCLECRGNTEGWKCDRCKEAHFGNPSEQNCMREYNQFYTFYILQQCDFNILQCKSYENLQITGNFCCK